MREGNLLMLNIPECEHSWVGFFLAAGSKYEETGNHGAAHLLEHVLIDNVEAYYDVLAETQAEFILLGSRQTKSDAAAAVRLWGERLFRGQLSPEVVEREKRIIEIELEELPLDQSYRAGVEALFGADSPCGRASGGSAEEIRALTVESLKEFRKQYASPGRCVCVVAGSFEAGAVREAAREFGLGSAVPQPAQERCEQKDQLVYVSDSNTDIATMRVFIPAVPIGDFTERIELKVLRTCMAGHHFSAVNRVLRDELGAAYTIETDSQYFTGDGYLMIGYFVPSMQKEEAAKRFRALVRQFPEHLSEQLFEMAKKRTILELTQAAHDPEVAAWWYGEDMLLTDGYYDLKREAIPQVEALDRARMAETAERYLAKEHVEIGL